MHATQMPKEEKRAVWEDDQLGADKRDLLSGRPASKHYYGIITVLLLRTVFEVEDESPTWLAGVPYGTRSVFEDTRTGSNTPLAVSGRFSGRQPVRITIRPVLRLAYFILRTEERSTKYMVQCTG